MRPRATGGPGVQMRAFSTQPQTYVVPDGDTRDTCRNGSKMFRSWISSICSTPSLPGVNDNSARHDGHVVPALTPTRTVGTHSIRMVCGSLGTTGPPSHDAVPRLSAT